MASALWILVIASSFFTLGAKVVSNRNQNQRSTLEEGMPQYRARVIKPFSAHGESGVALREDAAGLDLKAYMEVGGNFDRKKDLRETTHENLAPRDENSQQISDVDHPRKQESESLQNLTSRDSVAKARGLLSNPNILESIVNNVVKEVVKEVLINEKKQSDNSSAA